MKHRTSTFMFIMVAFIAIMTVILGGALIYQHTHGNEEMSSIVIQRKNEIISNLDHIIHTGSSSSEQNQLTSESNVITNTNIEPLPCKPLPLPLPVGVQDRTIPTPVVLNIKPPLTLQPSTSVISIPTPIEGVAVAILLHSPRWFTLRYTMMTNNVDNNIPTNWKIQIFYVSNGGSQKGIDLNVGLQKLIKNNRLILTEIPLNLIQKKKRRIELLTDLWFWDNVIANKVLLFGGNSVICGNSPRSITDFIHWDYIGTPWNSIKNGIGGDGGISYRNKTAMIEVIKYKYNTLPIGVDRENAYQTWPREDEFFIRTMLEINKKLGYTYYKIADRAATLQFGAMDRTIQDNTVFAVSGTLGGVNDTQRSKFIDYCIELKMIFPVLDNPNCFGAHPNTEECAKSICALKPGRKGGC